MNEFSNSMLLCVVFMLRYPVGNLVVLTTLHARCADRPRLLQAQGSGQQFDMPRVGLVQEAIGTYSQYPI